MSFQLPSTRSLQTAGLSGSMLLAATTLCCYEGRSLIAYVDPVGVPTICDGIIEGVKLGDTRTPAQCDAALAKQVREKTAAVDALVHVPMSPNTEAALISFTYNVGVNNFKSSTVLRKLNAGDKVGACNELTRWVYAGGKKLGGLVRRRAAERELCLR